jgi:hypothetical protein
MAQTALCILNHSRGVVTYTAKAIDRFLEVHGDSTAPQPLSLPLMNLPKAISAHGTRAWFGTRSRSPSLLYSTPFQKLKSDEPPETLSFQPTEGPGLTGHEDK